MCFKELGIVNSFTQESTFYGRDLKEGDDEDVDLHMQVQDFKQLGKDLVNTISYNLNEKFNQNLTLEAKNYE